MALKLKPSSSTSKKHVIEEQQSKPCTGYGSIVGGGGQEVKPISPQNAHSKSTDGSKSLKDAITRPPSNYCQEVTLNYSDLDRMGTASVKVKCFSCRNEVNTDVYVHAGPLTWGACLALSPTCFCWVPFTIDWCQEGVHKCPKCHAVIGVQKQC